MQLSIKSPVTGKLAVAGAYLFLVLIILASVRELVADKLAGYGSFGTLKAATRIIPENADYHFKLARYYDWIARDQPAALWQYQQAVRWNPHDSRSWIGLADIMGHRAMLTVNPRQSTKR